MLILSRKKYESIVVSGPCTVTVVEIRPGSVRLGFEAERNVTVLREEIIRPVDKDKRDGQNP